MSTAPLPSVIRYRHHIDITGRWCLRSAERGRGGSCAHFSPLMGWSKPYPETTGYLIPTLIKLAHHSGDSAYRKCAVELGGWLLDIQHGDGSWHGGLHPAKNAGGSVFNTGQILKGMAALYRESKDDHWLQAGSRGAEWLADSLGENGLWPAGDYQSTATPSYYSQVAWPMLEIWKLSGEPGLRAAAERHLDAVLNRTKENGVVAHWGFRDRGSAFTHTIAYTIRGFQEAARLIEDYERYGAPMEPALDVIYRKTGLTHGRLPGSFDENWNATGSYVCLTGNAQLAINLLLLEKQKPDLRLVDAAAKLVDFVGKVQCQNTPVPGMNGAVAGSWPLWGKYMFMRYPNWAAKYFCDALLLLSARLEAEQSGDIDAGIKANRPEPDRASSAAEWA